MFDLCCMLHGETDLADEELSGLLVLADLTESHGSRSVPMGLLDSSSGRSRLPCSLGGELLPGGLASGGLACSLLSTRHCKVFVTINTGMQRYK